MSCGAGPKVIKNWLPSAAARIISQNGVVGGALGGACKITKVVYALVFTSDGSKHAVAAVAAGLLVFAAQNALAIVVSPGTFRRKKAFVFWDTACSGFRETRVQDSHADRFI